MTATLRTGALAWLLALATLANQAAAAPPTLDGARSLELRAYELEEAQPEQAADNYLRAARAFEVLTTGATAPIEAFWKSARCYWQAGERLPMDHTEGRLVRFTLADALASRGLEVDPDCAECMLWKFAAMGRLRTTLGIWKGLRQVKDMADLLDRGIDLQPTYRDNDWNSTLGNLYYARAVFNRVVPDWIWLRWILGVRGDKEQAMRDIHAAIALHPDRLDYQVELGSQLLCRAATGLGEEEALAQGRRVLEHALTLEARTLDDRREQDATRIMLAHPERACGYTGDDWLDLDEKEARGQSE